MHTLNICMPLEYAARRVPDKTFLLAGPRRLSYADVDAQARRFANVLAGLGIGRGRRVILLFPNGPEFFVSYFGILKAGGVPVPLNASTPAPELGHYMRDAEPAALIADATCVQAATQARIETGFGGAFFAGGLPEASASPEGATRLEAALAQAAPEFETAPTQPDDEAVILYTSGTTGKPRGVVLTHFNLAYIGQHVGRDFWRVHGSDVIQMISPAGHIFGQTILHVACDAQATLSLMARFEPEAFLEAIQRDRVSFFAGVPTLAQLMLHSPAVAKYDLTSLRAVMFGGATLHAETARAFKARFGVELITGYGMTEGVPFTMLTGDQFDAAPAGTVGLPARGIRLRLVDEGERDVPIGELGEVVVRGPQVSRSYLNLPEETARSQRNGWFHTGDVGRMDPAGYLFLVDRVTDLIKRSGYSVAPAEVEGALLQHPAVGEAAVVGIPDSVRGEEIKAFVVLKPGHAVDEAELIDHCKQRLAAYKYPRSVEFRDALPKNPVGKVLRRLLRQPS